ncbi:MAG: hypothetical protein FJ320_09845 [SAR202 cluster bacterium]|nr:hypothetical protein [SAR202 cluster bacterium]
MKRTNWHSDHPPACTCADCSQRKFEQRRLAESTGGRKIGRNEPCPCGSGKKYKKCHAS